MGKQYFYDIYKILKESGLSFFVITSNGIHYQYDNSEIIENLATKSAIFYIHSDDISVFDYVDYGTFQGKTLDLLKEKNNSDQAAMNDNKTRIAELRQAVKELRSNVDYNYASKLVLEVMNLAQQSNASCFVVIDSDIIGYSNITEDRFISTMYEEYFNIVESMLSESVI